MTGRVMIWWARIWGLREFEIKTDYDQVIPTGMSRFDAGQGGVWPARLIQLNVSVG
jgi:hypothetical protein